MEGVAVAFVVQKQNGRLEHSYHELMFLLQVGGLQLYLTMIEEPIHLSVSEVVQVELLEVVLDPFQYTGNLALGRILEGPVATREDFGTELDAVYVLVSTMQSCSVVGHGLLGFHYVFKHSLDFVHRVVAAFNLELPNHELLSLIGERRLVEESLGK